MNGEIDKYNFPETVNEQRRIIGLAWDEFLVVALPILFGILLKCSLIMIVIAVLSWILIRTLKSGRGTQYMANIIYWYLPYIHFFFRKIPSSGLRHWVN
ncbi:type IV conjugative transfer system protein TraL [Rosenbergiella collisarenosi]|uniref:type IV conjugative transfer system protein TraL n=1 Tax=Rosenbergiella collisarenosi TaxID=1544695 RepID=UPI001F4DDE35|nr:type IV conjugative transfer system protein TraL [Rosenbergiella collisarenosi]